MSYYSMLTVAENSATFGNIPKLNEKIKSLDADSAKITIIEYANGGEGDIEPEGGDYRGKFYDARQFAELLSENIISGKIELIYNGDRYGALPDGFIITPGKVAKTKAVMVPEPDNGYDGLKAQLKDAMDKLDEIKSKLNDAFAGAIKEKYPDDFEKIQGLFEYPVVKIIAKEYLDERAGWCRTVEITAEGVHNNEPIIQSREYVVKTGNEWYGDADDGTNFIYEVDAYIQEILERIYDEFPYLITDYMG